jgi:putative PIN family toxin of toxin-antitoxin system
MKVIIDTNVVVSAALKGRNPEEVILRIVSNPEKYQWMVSSEILSEYKEVLSRSKFHLSPADIKRWYRLIDAFTTVINVDLSIDFPRDTKDAKFLACALAAEADFLVTGDRDFTEAQKLIKTTIISVYSFKELLEPQDPERGIEL